MAGLPLYLGAVSSHSLPSLTRFLSFPSSINDFYKSLEDRNAFLASFNYFTLTPYFHSFLQDVCFFFLFLFRWRYFHEEAKEGNRNLPWSFAFTVLRLQRPPVSFASCISLRPLSSGSVCHHSNSRQ